MFLLIGCGVKPSDPVTHLNAPAAVHLLKNEADLTVIDVRTPKEFSSGSIVGARNLDLQSASFKSEVKELDPMAPYLVYCRSGNRSTQALEVFKQQNFTQIYHLNGGVKAWKQAGLKLE